MNHRLLQLLVCPVCKGPLEHRRTAQPDTVELLCHADHLAFSVRDGIPLMLESAARRLGGPDTPTVAAIA